MIWLKDLWDTFKHLKVPDVLDISVMACLVYFILLWFKRTKAAFVARGIFIFAMVYVIAQQAGMYLTTWLFQGFFAIFVIALVIIFQEEIRSFFERIAVWSLGRRSSHPLQPEEVEILVRTSGHFARERIGALIVLKGLDPLERHIEGGESLDGKVSEPLLESLFDPHSIGHDGAVVIENDRVVQFGVHLPLSKEFSKLGNVGTRHAAALGLSERTDALCIVVSEERGTISLARNGSMSIVDNLEFLEERVASFFREMAPKQVKHRWWQDAWRRNPNEKAIALVISVALWLVFVQGFNPSSNVFKVPVEARSVDDRFRVMAVRPQKVTVTVHGLKRDLKLLNPWNLKVSMVADQAEEGTHQIMITEESLSLPGTVALIGVDPPFVELELSKSKGKPFLHLFGTPPEEKPTPAPVEEEGHVQTTP